MSAYDNGYDYACDSPYSSMEDNPYPTYSKNWYDWNEGFNDAVYSIDDNDMDDLEDLFGDDYIDDMDRPY